MKTTYLFTIKAEDTPGLLGQILAMFNRRRYRIESVTASKTDKISEVIIVVECLLELAQVIPLQRQLEKIIEVTSVNAKSKNQCVYQKVSLWKLRKSILETPQGWLIDKYKAQMINIDQNSILISKCGNEESLHQLHELLKGQYLLGYAETGLISEQAFTNDDEARISRLAA